MRVVSGKYRGRRLHPPKGMAARPTTDFAKQALFNILQHSVPLEGIRVLDLFAGTGNIAVEFLSRGAEAVLSVDHDRELYAFLQRTARDLNETAWSMVRAEVFPFLRSHSARYDIIFADPPFEMEGTTQLPTLVRERGLLEPEGLLIVEHSKRVDMSGDPWFQRERIYGNVHFSFFKPAPDPLPSTASTDHA